MSGSTIKAARSINANADAEFLEKAMKGAGTDEAAIIQLLTQRSVDQRKQIALAYKATYGKDLHERLRSELSGNFRRCVLYSFYDMAHVNALACYKAMKGAGTDEQILIDVICTSTNKEMIALKSAYSEILVEKKQNALRRSLEFDIKNDTTGDFERILVALCQAKREETDASDAQIQKDVEELYQGGVAKTGTDEATFTRILVSRSWESIRKINQIYERTRNHDLLNAIEKETSGDYEKALKTIVKSALNRNQCYADVLLNSIEGAGTHDDNLIRFIIAHSEVDLAIIRRTFDGLSKKNLYEMIKGDTSGDYRSYLLEILGQ